MYRKTKTIISSILASVLIESMVFTSVASPIVDYNIVDSEDSGVSGYEDVTYDTKDSEVNEQENKKDIGESSNEGKELEDREDEIIEIEVEESEDDEEGGTSNVVNIEESTEAEKGEEVEEADSIATNSNATENDTEDEEEDLELENDLEELEQESTLEIEEKQIIDKDTPLKVKEFIEAVESLKDITVINKDNVEEVGNRLNKVLEIYETLDYEYMDREDVNEALEFIYEMSSAIEHILGLETSELKIVTTNNYNDRIEGKYVTLTQSLGVDYWDPSDVGSTLEYNSYAGSVTKHVGDKGNYQLLARKDITCNSCDRLITRDYARYYTDIKTDLSDDTIINNLYYSIGNDIYDPYVGYAENRRLNYTANKPGQTKVSISSYANFVLNDEYFICKNHSYWKYNYINDMKWHFSNGYFYVTVEGDYKLNYNTQGGSSISSNKVTSSKTQVQIPVTSNIPTKRGYNFLGWSEDKDAKVATIQKGQKMVLDWKQGYGSVSKPVETTLYAVWEPKETEYKIEYYDEDGILLKTSDTFKGFVNDKVSVSDTDKVIENYIFDSENTNNVTNITLDEDGNILKLYFKKQKGTYKIEWYDENDNVLKTSEVIEGNKGDSVSASEDDKILEDYEFDSTNTNNIETVILGDELQIIKLYFKRTELTYKVYWLDEGGESIKETDIRKGYKKDTVGIDESDKLVDDYTFDIENENNILSGDLLDDSLELKLYFKKIKDIHYTIERYNEDGELLGDIIIRNNKEGVSVSVEDSDKVIEGYVFDLDNELNVLDCESLKEGTVLRLYFKTVKPATPSDADKDEEPDDKDDKPATPSDADKEEDKKPDTPDDDKKEDKPIVPSEDDKKEHNTPPKGDDTDKKEDNIPSNSDDKKPDTPSNDKPNNTIKEDTKPSGSEGNTNKTINKPNTINDSSVPLSQANKVKSINSSIAAMVPDSFNVAIDEMLIPLSEKPDEENNLDTLPKTSDNTDIILYELIILISCIGLDLLRKKRR